MPQTNLFFRTMFGVMAAAFEFDAVTGLRFADVDADATVDADAPPACQGSAMAPLADVVIGQLGEYFGGARRGFTFPVRLVGTPFQLAVWNALNTIPYGETRSYKQIAQIIGRSGASRAVGAAIGRNPVWVAVPCHRVIGANGSLRGYAGGTVMKERLLRLEAEALGKRNAAEFRAGR